MDRPRAKRRLASPLCLRKGAGILRVKLALLISCAVVGLLLAVLATVGDPSRWPPPESPLRQGEAAGASVGAGQVMHSPQALGRLIREPQNTWSNLAFVFGGALLLGTIRTRLGRGMGLALLAVGVGSFLYHASASRTLRHLDVAAMYWLFLVAALLSLGAVAPRLQLRLQASAGGLLIATSLVAVALTWGRNFSVLGFKPFSLTLATGIAAATMIAALVLVAWRKRSRATFAGVLGCVGVFTLALVCQLGDRPGGWLFAPGGALQAHALWHVFSAGALVGTVLMLDRPVT